MITEFSIQDTEFTVNIDVTARRFEVESVPRPYAVSFVESDNFTWLAQQVNTAANSLLLIDQYVKDTLLSHVDFAVPTMTVTAVEDNKGIDTVLKICDWLLTQRANRGSHLYVVGGGIIQDLGAFSAYMYKRGIPWTLVPTTLLSQADSGLGGKTAVNYGSSKNVLGLYSAPRAVINDAAFTASLTERDFLSGGGEILRLCVTGGAVSYGLLKTFVARFVARDAQAIQYLTSASLHVKRAIVEKDEFEIDIRRSMNYGHSIGHAIEALSKYMIPHGQAVTLGILVENQISVNRGLLPQSMSRDIAGMAHQLISPDVWHTFCNLDLNQLLPYLANDKKAEGQQLKLAIITEIGTMKFVDLALDNSGLDEVIKAVNEVQSL